MTQSVAKAIWQQGKRVIQHGAEKVGVDLYRLGPSSNLDLQVALGLATHGVDLVLDVGANSGQFAKSIRHFGYGGKIVSFEPLLAPHKALSASAESDPKWTVHPRAAIGSETGTIEINESENSVSSSILSITDVHTNASQSSKIVSTQTVDLTTIDAAMELYKAEAKAPFVKIDTQGYEWAVLDGATETLARAKGVQCEVSIVELYEGQRLWVDVVDRLNKFGFEIWGLHNGFCDHKTGASLQFEIIAFKK